MKNLWAKNGVWFLDLVLPKIQLCRTRLPWVRESAELRVDNNNLLQLQLLWNHHGISYPVISVKANCDISCTMCFVCKVLFIFLSVLTLTVNRSNILFTTGPSIFNRFCWTQLLTLPVAKMWTRWILSLLIKMPYLAFLQNNRVTYLHNICCLTLCSLKRFDTYQQWLNAPEVTLITLFFKIQMARCLQDIYWLQNAAFWHLSTSMRMSIDKQRYLMMESSISK